MYVSNAENRMVSIDEACALAAIIAHEANK